MASPTMNGVHFVGSVPVPSAETCFRTLSAALPRQLKRLPDGEPGTRDTFTHWQLAVVESYDPRAVRLNPEAPLTYSDDESEDILRSFDAFETQYDDYALESYATFRRLKDQGMIEKGVRFQVCIPTPVNAVFLCVHPSLRSKFEPIYEDALLRSLRRIEDGIPHDELSIQFDCPTEFGMIENANFYGLEDFVPWFEPVLEGSIERLAKIIDSVAKDVEVGLHLCYGNITRNRIH